MRLPRRAGGARGGNHLVLIALVLATVGVLAAAGSGLEGPTSSSGGGGGRTASEAGDATLTLALASAPESLDPALADDRAAVIVLRNVLDPLVRLGPGAQPLPNLAREWETSAGGRRVTFSLRDDGRWTNGDRVTAADFEYAWKRVLAPETGSPHASRLFDIDGAAAYNGCVDDECPRLADEVGVRAADDVTLVVRLAEPAPWFVGATAHPAFLPVHRPTVERFGPRWTDRRNVVTNGPFLLAGLEEDSVSLAKSRGWRDAGRVSLERVEGRVIADGLARTQAFDAGQVMALDGSGLPSIDLPALRERQEFDAYPGLGVYLYAFNLATISDVHQRRAMALALNRRGIVDNVAVGAQLPATRLLSPAAADYGSPAPDSPWFPPEGDLEAAGEQLDASAVVKRQLTLIYIEDGPNRRLATAVRDAWRQIGIETTLRGRPEEEYLDFDGPLSRDSADVYQLDHQHPVPDPVGVLGLWTCEEPMNKTNFCNGRYDGLIEEAREEADPVARDVLYTGAEEVVAGENGALPGVPLFWHTYPNLESLRVKSSFAIDPLGLIDLATVEIR